MGGGGSSEIIYSFLIRKKLVNCFIICLSALLSILCFVVTPSLIRVSFIAVILQMSGLSFYLSGGRVVL